MENIKIIRSARQKVTFYNICIEAKNGLTFDPFTISDVFKKSFSNLAKNLVLELPVVAEKFGNKSVGDYYNDILNPKRLIFQTTVQTDRSINWFTSYFSNRSFRLNIQGKFFCIAKLTMECTRELS